MSHLKDQFMDDKQESRARSEREIFFAALDRAAGEERTAFLDGACGADLGLRRRVEALLARHFEKDSFMKGPALEEMPTLAEGPHPAEEPGALIGRYKLLEKLGEGGFGSVWAAVQREPVRRRVALKIIKLGMDTKQVVARFEAERQALALMDHPNIARVLDAGATERGRPYFVMELVRGIPITRYCDQERLGANERLELFIKVCHAIQHAHQKGIIHRDIKPSNIMVTLHDGVPVPKVIDFGIAKATQMELTEKTIHTQLQQFIGTPAYMSPEQAEMSGLDIDTRTDIYSLGVLLYELLTGSTPFDTRELMQSGVDEMRKIIREREPARPSTRLTQRRDPTPPVKNQETKIEKDLDWIVMKCLEKDRARRYETSNGLAMDIERHLKDEPVMARPPSTAYKVQKAFRRNKLAYGAAAAVALAVLLGSGVSMWQTLRAMAAQKEEGKQRKIAEASTIEARRQAYEAALNQYVSDVGLAFRLLQEGRLGPAEEILRAHIPQEAGQADFRSFEWDSLWRLCQGDALSTLARQDAQFPSISVSRDGRRIATCRADELSLYSTESPAESQEPLAVHSGEFRTVAFSPIEPDLLVVGHLNGEVSVRSGRLVQEEQLLDGRHDGSVRHIVFAPSGALFATGAHDGKVLWWNTAERRLVHTTEVGFGIHAMNISDDGRTLAVGGPANSIMLIDVETRKERVIDVPVRWTHSLAFFPGSPELVALGGEGSGRIQVVNTSNGEGFELRGHDGIVNDIRSLNDGTTLVSGGRDHTIRMWDTDSRRSLGVLKGHDGWVWRIAVSPDGSKFYSAARYGTIKSWETAVPADSDALQVNADPVAAVDFSPDGNWLASGHLDGHIVLWDARTGTEAARRRTAATGGVTGIGFHPRRPILLAAGKNGMIEVWDDRLREKEKEFRAHSTNLNHLAISPDGRFFASGTGGILPEERTNGEFRLWDAETYEPLSEPTPVYERAIGALSFTSDGGKLVMGGMDGWVRLFDVPSFRLIAEKPGHGMIISSAVSRNASLLATGSRSSRVVVSELPSLTRVAELRAVTDDSAMTFSPDGKTLIVGYLSGAIRFWNIETGREMFSLEAHEEPVLNLVLAPDGQTLASSGGDGMIRLWPAARFPPRTVE
jgi:eukaryotic-like serine/threonine-protein kinase